MRGGVHGTPKENRANKEVIHCGGANNTPQMLQHSGIGPASLLQSHGIPVQHDLPGVGENIGDHNAPRFVARVKNIITINELARGPRLVGEVAKWMLSRKGILSLNPTLIYCFWRSDPGVANSDIQLTFTPASYKEGVQSQLDDFPGVTVASWQQRPESRGYVRVRSSDPFAAPIIQSNYLALEGDRRILLAAMKLARTLLASNAMKPYYDREDFPGPGVKSDDELLAAAK
jgi:choline dehydrogenase